MYIYIAHIYICIYIYMYTVYVYEYIQFYMRTVTINHSYRSYKAT